MSTWYLLRVISNDPVILITPCFAALKIPIVKEKVMLLIFLEERTRTGKELHTFV